jgi:hypothetical protein
VDDAPLMRVFHPLGDLPGDMQGFVQWNGGALIAIQSTGRVRSE